MAIGEVASRSGVPASTLRYYESVGLLPAPRRVSGRRQYDVAVLDRLVVIKAARRVGLSLTDIHELLQGMTTSSDVVGESWRALAARKLPEMDAIIEEFIAVRALLRALESCQCRDLAECAALLKDCRRERGMQSSRLPNRIASVADYSQCLSPLALTSASVPNG